MTEFPYQYLGVLMMPTDSCNMNCVYCFNSRRPRSAGIRMSDEILKHTIECVVPYYRKVRFIWHGGEPLLMGRAFYERVLELQERVNRNGTVVENSIQTNLTLIDEDLAHFFVDHQFHIGSSFDGFCTNDLTRGNTQKILKGYDRLKHAGGHNGFICVIQRQNIDSLVEDYEEFKRRGMNYTLNPYLTSPPYDQDPLFVPENECVQKLCAFYDYWMFDTACNIQIGYFKQFLDYLLYGFKELCVYNSCLGKHIGVHWDGTLYACNRDFPEKYCFGNVLDYEDIRDCFASKGFEALLSDAIRRRNACKQQCPLFDFCAGGCNSTALAAGRVDQPNEYACEVLRGVYEHIARQIETWKTETPERLEKVLNPVLVKMLQKYQELNRNAEK